MKHRYAFKSEKENIVKVVGKDVGISTKQAIEICSYIKNRPLGKARTMLEKVMDKKLAVPFKRFTEGAGHKKGLSGGRYPIKASKQFLNLLKALEANAQNKGLSSNLKIIHACAHKAATPLRYGRKRRISMKRSHVEIVAEETEPVKKDAKKEDKKKPVKKAEEKKVEEKKEEIKPAAGAKEKPEDKKKAEAKTETKLEVKKEEVKKETKEENNKAAGAEPKGQDDKEAKTK